MKAITKLLFIHVLLFSTSWGKAQDTLHNVKEPPLYRAYYNYTHIKDTTKRQQLYTEKMLLLIGEKHALYLSYDKLLEHIAIDDYIKQRLAEGEEDIKMKPAKVITPEEILIEYGSTQALINTYLARHFNYLYPITPINWVISTEQKEILGLNCYKATSSYLGRKWEVWFAPEISLPAGPWFLQGLPGMIVSANDDKNEVKFELESVEGATLKNEVIERMEDYKLIQMSNAFRSTRLKDENELLALRHTAKKDLFTFKTAQIHAMHDIGGTLDYGVSNTLSWSADIPNPINLTSKK